MKSFFLVAAILVLSVPTQLFGMENVAQFLQDISVTIKAGGAEGSGTIVTRKVGEETVNFVWTAGHVVEHLRKVRSVIDPLTMPK